MQMRIFAAAIFAPTLTDTGNVNIYDKLNAGFESARNNKITVATYTSNLNRAAGNGFGGALGNSIVGLKGRFADGGVFDQIYSKK